MKKYLFYIIIHSTIWLLHTISYATTSEDYFNNPYNIDISEKAFYKDQLNSEQTLKVYQFILTEKTNVHIHTVSESEIKITVMDTERKTIPSQTKTEENFFSQNLDQGTYFIQVEKKLSSDDIYDYKLFTQFNKLDRRKDRAGNAFDTAYQLGKLSQEKIFSDWIGPSDNNDYIEFTLDKQAQITLELQGDTKTLFTLFDKDYELIATTRFSSDFVKSPSLVTTLKPGRYYIHLFNFFNEALYTLSLSKQNLKNIPADKAGNSIDQSKELGILTNSDTTIKDWVGILDEDDFYHFELDKDSKVILKSIKDYNNLEIKILDQNGQIIITTEALKSFLPETSFTLEAGSYYLDISTQGSDTVYEFHISSELAPPAPLDEAGNSLQEAKKIPFYKQNTYTIEEWVGSRDREDYFRFKLEKETTIFVKLTNLHTDVTLDVLNAFNTIVAQSAKNSINDEYLTLTLGPGIYFIRVWTHFKDTSYTLTLTNKK